MAVTQTLIMMRPSFGQPSAGNLDFSKKIEVYKKF